MVKSDPAKNRNAAKLNFRKNGKTTTKRRRKCKRFGNKENILGMINGFTVTRFDPSKVQLHCFFGIEQISRSETLKQISFGDIDEVADDSTSSFKNFTPAILTGPRTFSSRDSLESSPIHEAKRRNVALSRLVIENADLRKVTSTQRHRSPKLSSYEEQDLDGEATIQDNDENDRRVYPRTPAKVKVGLEVEKTVTTEVLFEEEYRDKILGKVSLECLFVDDEISEDCDSAPQDDDSVQDHVSEFLLDPKLDEGNSNHSYKDETVGDDKNNFSENRTDRTVVEANTEQLQIVETQLDVLTSITFSDSILNEEKKARRVTLQYRSPIRQTDSRRRSLLPLTPDDYADLDLILYDEPFAEEAFESDKVPLKSIEDSAFLVVQSMTNSVALNASFERRFNSRSNITEDYASTTVKIIQEDSFKPLVSQTLSDEEEPMEWSFIQNTPRSSLVSDDLKISPFEFFVKHTKEPSFTFDAETSKTCPEKCYVSMRDDCKMNDFFLSMNELEIGRNMELESNLIADENNEHQQIQNEKTDSCCVISEHCAKTEVEANVGVKSAEVSCVYNCEDVPIDAAKLFNDTNDLIEKVKSEPHKEQICKDLTEHCSQAEQRSEHDLDSTAHGLVSTENESGNDSENEKTDAVEKSTKIEQVHSEEEHFVEAEKFFMQSEMKSTEGEKLHSMKDKNDSMDAKKNFTNGNRKDEITSEDSDAEVYPEGGESKTNSTVAEKCLEIAENVSFQSRIDCRNDVRETIDEMNRNNDKENCGNIEAETEKVLTKASVIYTIQEELPKFRTTRQTRNIVDHGTEDSNTTPRRTTRSKHSALLSRQLTGTTPKVTSVSTRSSKIVAFQTSTAQDETTPLKKSQTAERKTTSKTQKATISKATKTFAVETPTRKSTRRKVVENDD